MSELGNPVEQVRMQTATVATAVKSVAPATAGLWAKVSALLWTAGGVAVASPLPFPWGLVVGGVLGVAGAVTGFVAAKRLDGDAAGALIQAVVSALAAHNAAQGSKPEGGKHGEG